MPAEHALLGLLAMGEAARPGHGYDLAREFAAGKPLAAVLRLEPGMLYHHLKKLARAGWVEAVDDVAGGRPPRRLHRLTATGRAELDRWLAAPVGHTREIRLEFLVKLYFARGLAPERLPRLLAEQRAVLDRLLASLDEQRARAGRDAGDEAADESDDGTGDAAGDSAYLRLVLDLRAAQTRAALAWLDAVADAIG